MSRMLTNREEVQRWLSPEIRLTRAKAALREVDVRPGAEGEILLSLSKERGVVPRAEYGDPTGRADSLEDYKLVRRDQVVMNKMQAWNGVFGLSPGRGLVSPDYSVFEVLPGHDPRFITYLLRSDFYATQFAWRSRGMGTAFLRLHPENLLDTPVPDLAAEEQRVIADYLDAAASRIDAAVEALRRQVASLASRPQAVVSESLSAHASTGLPVRRVVTAVTSGPRGWANRVVEEPGSPFLRISNVPPGSIDLRLDELAYVDAPRGEESDRCRVRGGDVLVSITAAIGQVAVVPDSLDGAFISQHLALLRPDRRRIVPDWLAMAVWTADAQAQLDVARYGGTKQQLSLDDVRDLWIPVPALEVQRETVARLREEIEAVERVQKLRSRQIDLLLERRQALITAAVTGQLEIPGVAA